MSTPATATTVTTAARSILRLLVGSAIALALLAILGLRSEPGRALWVASRSAGITAFVALSLDVTFGLLLSTGLAYRWISRPRGVEVHRWLSSATLALTAAHAAALVGDRFARIDLFDVLVPFQARYRPVAVGLGVIAAYLAVVLHGSFALRARLGARLWRSLHYLSFVLYAVVAAHGIFAGSDAGLAGVRTLFAVSAGVVVSLTGYRVLSSRRWSRAETVPR